MSATPGNPPKLGHYKNKDEISSSEIGDGIEA
jgi:hypothetical protein